MNFDNNIELVTGNRDDIEKIFDENFGKFGWKFNIDYINEPKTKRQDASKVLCHFLDKETFEPIENDKALVQYEVVYNSLTLALAKLGLTLNQKNGFDIGDNIDDTGDDNINILGVTFIILSSILGMMFAFLAVAYIIRVKHLERKIKAINATSHVTKVEQNGHLDHFKEPLPNTNQHSSQGQSRIQLASLFKNILRPEVPELDCYLLKLRVLIVG